MTGRRLGELVRGIGGFAGLLVLVVGVPVALVVGVGWPLPHAVPDMADLHRLFAGRYNPSGSFYLKVVSIVAWIAWAEVAICAVAEIRAAIAGGRAWRVRFAGPIQPLVAALVVAVVLALPPGGGEAPAHTPSLAVALSRPVSSRRITLVADDLGEARLGPAAKYHAGGRRSRSRAGRTRPDHRAARDTLWGLAERYLGNPLDWREIFDLNVGKPQPGGGSLTDPSLIRPGWVLELPREQPHMYRTSIGLTIVTKGRRTRASTRRRDGHRIESRRHRLHPTGPRRSRLTTMGSGTSTIDPTLHPAVAGTRQLRRVLSSSSRLAPSSRPPSSLA